MPLCMYANDAGMFASTPVANLFIQEYLLQAPGDYVKVYLYGLMQSVYPSTAENSIRKFAISLGLDVESVQKAFSYWVNKGILRERTSGHGYEYLDVRNVLYEGVQSLSERRMVDFSELSERISAAAPDRNFSSAELESLYDMKDVDGFDEDAIVLMIEYCVKRHGKKFKRKDLQTLTSTWQSKSLTTSKKVKEYTLGIELSQSAANAVLIQFGIMHRNVSVAEYKLYEKWIQAWEFSHEAILVAAQTPSVRNPNFDYLDKKLATLYGKQLTTKEAIVQEKETKDDLDVDIRQCKHRLGISGSITDQHRSEYKKWRFEYGLSTEIILMICDEAVNNNMPTFSYVGFLAKDYADRGLHSVEAIQDDLSLVQDIKLLLQNMGQPIKVTPTIKKDFTTWMQTMPFEVIMQAAEYAKTADRPMGYLSRIIQKWQEKGIRTVAAAREEHNQHMNEYAISKPQKASSLHFDYEQHTSQDFSALIDDLGALKET